LQFTSAFQKLWSICAEKGDIYLDSYEGWYNEREEAFVTDMDAEASDFKDPGNRIRSRSGSPKPRDVYATLLTLCSAFANASSGTGLALKRVTEESYFFRMSKYEGALVEFLETHPSFLQPEQYRVNILARLRKEGLKDLSISRTSFTWGIPLPEGFDKRHVMYVWFDALSNYLSGTWRRGSPCLRTGTGMG